MDSPPGSPTTTKLVLTWVHRNPQAKRQINPVTRFCTAHGKMCYIHSEPLKTWRFMFEYNFG